MDCEDIKKLVPLLADGDSLPEDLRAHFSECEGCRKEMAAYEKTWEMLGSWKDIEPDPGYVSRFWTRLSMKKSWYESPGLTLKSFLWERRLAPVFAVVSIVLVVGVMTWRISMRTLGNETLLTALSTEEIEFAEFIELAENLDVIQDMEFLEDLDVIENLDTEV